MPFPNAAASPHKQFPPTYLFFNCCNAQLVKQESALPFEAPFLLGQPTTQVCVLLLTYFVLMIRRQQQQRDEEGWHF